MKREITIALLCLVVGISTSYFLLPRHGVKVYDCSIAEISPDYPLEVKDGCRKLRMEKTT